MQASAVGKLSRDCDVVPRCYAGSSVAPTTSRIVFVHGLSLVHDLRDRSRSWGGLDQRTCFLLHLTASPKELGFAFLLPFVLVAPPILQALLLRCPRRTCCTSKYPHAGLGLNRQTLASRVCHGRLIHCRLSNAHA